MVSTWVAGRLKSEVTQQYLTVHRFALCCDCHIQSVMQSVRLLSHYSYVSNPVMSRSDCIDNYNNKVERSLGFDKHQTFA